MLGELEQELRQVPLNLKCLHSKHWSGPGPQQPSDVHSSEQIKPSDPVTKNNEQLNRC